MIFDLGDHSLETEGQDFYVAENATVLGKVRLCKDASVWFGAVLRGDTELITIGERSNVQDCAVLHTDHGFPLNIGKDVTIGHHVMIGPNVVLRASNHVTENVSRPIWEQGQTGGKITIGDDVWIGANVVVLPNVSIGSHVVVAAGAVVTKDVLDNVIVAGVPATILRHR